MLFPIHTPVRKKAETKVPTVPKSKCTHSFTHHTGAKSCALFDSVRKEKLRKKKKKRKKPYKNANLSDCQGIKPCHISFMHYIQASVTSSSLPRISKLFANIKE